MKNIKGCQKKCLKVFLKLMLLEHLLTFPFLESLVNKSFKDIYNPLTCFSRKSGKQKF